MYKEMGFKGGSWINIAMEGWGAQALQGELPKAHPLIWKPNPEVQKDAKKKKVNT